jgi:hypothetical protein
MTKQPQNEKVCIGTTKSPIENDNYSQNSLFLALILLFEHQNTDTVCDYFFV